MAKKKNKKIEIKVKVINFDMDGTIANLYGVENWLDYLINHDATPYKEAKPLVNMNSLARIINRLQREGYTLNIVSWLAKNSDSVYDDKVIEAKKEWLKKHLASVNFDNIIIVPYGTPKHELANGVLFDDEKPNRDKWNEHNEKAFDVDNLIEILKALK